MNTWGDYLVSYGLQENLPDHFRILVICLLKFLSQVSYSAVKSTLSDLFSSIDTDSHFQVCWMLFPLCADTKHLKFTLNIVQVFGTHDVGRTNGVTQANHSTHFSWDSVCILLDFIQGRWMCQKASSTNPVWEVFSEYMRFFLSSFSI